MVIYQIVNLCQLLAPWVSGTVLWQSHAHLVTKPCLCFVRILPRLWQSLARVLPTGWQAGVRVFPQCSWVLYQWVTTVVTRIKPFWLTASPPPLARWADDKGGEILALFSASEEKNRGSWIARFAPIFMQKSRIKKDFSRERMKHLQ